MTENTDTHTHTLSFTHTVLLFSIQTITDLWLFNLESKNPHTALSLPQMPFPQMDVETLSSFTEVCFSGTSPSGCRAHWNSFLYSFALFLLEPSPTHQDKCPAVYATIQALSPTPQGARASVSKGLVLKTQSCSSSENQGLKFRKTIHLLLVIF